MNITVSTVLRFPTVIECTGLDMPFKDPGASFEPGEGMKAVYHTPRCVYIFDCTPAVGQRVELEEDQVLVWKGGGAEYSMYALFNTNLFKIREIAHTITGIEVTVEEWQDEPEKYRGYTVEEWYRKYQVADKDRMNASQKIGELTKHVREWSDASLRISQALGLEWPEGIDFETFVCTAFQNERELRVNAEKELEHEG